MTTTSTIIGFAIVNTKTNFKNLNGKQLPLKSINGSTITLEVYNPESDKFISTEFSMNEIIYLKLDSKHGIELFENKVYFA
jgi:hypothetical protein